MEYEYRSLLNANTVIYWNEYRSLLNVRSPQRCFYTVTHLFGKGEPAKQKDARRAKPLFRQAPAQRPGRRADHTKVITH